MKSKEIINILIICDSHGTPYGVEKPYSEILKEEVKNKGYYVNIIALGGIKIGVALEKILLDSKHYDYVIIQYGNSDIHPRIRYKVLNNLAFIHHSLGRDGLYTLLPQISIRYFVKIPLFLIRRIFLLFGSRIQTNYSDYISTLRTIVERYTNSKLYILPLFNINKIIYGNGHNRNAKNINELLIKYYSNCIVEEELLHESIYSKYYNSDYFHFNQEYHRLLAKILMEKINE